MARLKSNGAKASTPAMDGPVSSPLRRSLSIAVVAKRQTTEQRHRLHAAVDALLVEMVRQEIGRRKGHEPWND